MADEFICDARKLGSFIGKVKEIAAGGGPPRQRLDWPRSGPFSAD